MKDSKLRQLAVLVAVFAAAYWFPIADSRWQGALLEAAAMLREYARQHVLLCLVPALFIAGAISIFVSQASVLRYLGPKANRVLSYGVASISGSILAVCSCTVLPMFAGIYSMGAGIGPATAFLYSGPAINVMAIILTARVLGFEMGLARAVGAVAFSIVLGVCMHLIFGRRERERADDTAFNLATEGNRSLARTTLYMGTMVGILVFANWSRPIAGLGIWAVIYSLKWWLTGGLGLILLLMLWRWFSRAELGEWVNATWEFALQILPLLFAGVAVAGFLLGRPGHPALIPEHFVARLVGGNSLQANLFASVAGALMYFATLTEVPILQGLLGAGMGKGPALALLLAGPSLSLPSLLVLGRVLGPLRTTVYASLVVILATVTGAIYGTLS